MTWNATGIMSSSSYLSDALNEHSVDFCGISEHWLYNKDLHFLDKINNNYISHATSDKDLLLPVHRKVGKGGVALLWNRKLDSYVTTLDKNSDRIIGIQIKYSPHSYMYLFQVYLPSRSHVLDVYKTCIEELENILSMYMCKGIVIIMGDMNAQIFPRAHSCRIDGRDQYFLDFIEYNNIVSVSSLDIRTGPNTTFVSFDGKSESHIDHILVPYEKCDLISSCNIPDDCSLNVSSHRPVLCSIQVPHIFSQPSTQESDVINWSKVKQDDKKLYTESLQNDVILNEVLNREIRSEGDVDNMYNQLVNRLNDTTKKCISKSKFKPHLKPYWNKELTDAHQLMKYKRTLWKESGKPRGSTYLAYREYKQAKTEFRKLHREIVSQYLKELDDQINTAAEIDTKRFLKLIKSRRSKTGSKATSEITFNGTTYRDPQEINEQWQLYFAQLYTPDESEIFDSNVKTEVEHELRHIKQDCRDIPNSLTIDDHLVSDAIKTSKQGRACGEDRLYYESIKYGGVIVKDILLKLFTTMLNFSHTPKSMKRGIIITLYKGGNKKKNDPNSYRAITLSSLILKLYEKVILTLCKEDGKAELNMLQTGFQPNMGCMMTAFMVRESMHFTAEFGSKLYMCFLDIRQAFDRVWQDLLMVKLYRKGFNISLIKATIDLYEDMFSCVRSQGVISDWFPVKQGTRQGGCLSPFLYLVFGNDLLDELSRSAYCFMMYGMQCGFPAYADDLLLLSLLKRGMNCLMDICFSNSIMERCLYHYLKTNVMVANETKPKYLEHIRTWSLGGNNIEETESYTHLGVICNKYLNLNSIIEGSCKKLRSTFLSLINSGVYEDGFHPLTSRHLYQTIVLPKALYGCKLWNSLNLDHIFKLEKAHRFCIKYMQSIPKDTRTVIALSCVGAVSIETEIDRRKLIFFGQLCNLLPDMRVKEIFVYRLVHYINSPCSITGFLPDIHRILGKYGLEYVMYSFISDGKFPSKQSWKTLVTRNIMNVETANLQCAIANEQSLHGFEIIHGEVCPCPIWEFSKENREHTNRSITVMNLLSRLFGFSYDKMCILCGLQTDSIAVHLIMYCRGNCSVRTRLWNTLYTYLGQDNYELFIDLTPREQCIEILASLPSFTLTESTRKECSTQIIIFLHKLGSSLRLPYKRGSGILW